jgi:hypothetical protein
MCKAMTFMNKIRRHFFSFAFIPASALALTLAASGCSRNHHQSESMSSGSAGRSQSVASETASRRSTRVAGDEARRRDAMSARHEQSPEEHLAGSMSGVTGSASSVEGEWARTEPGIDTVPHAGEMGDHDHPSAMSQPAPRATRNPAPPVQRPPSAAAPSVSSSSPQAGEAEDWTEVDAGMGQASTQENWDNVDSGLAPAE